MSRITEDDKKEIFRLAGKCSPKEIAEATGLSVVQIKYQLSKLQEDLSPEREEESESEEEHDLEYYKTWMEFYKDLYTKEHLEFVEYKATNPEED